RSDLGRLGRVDQSHSVGASLKTGLLGRLGRVFQTHAGTEQPCEQKEDRATEKLDECEGSVPGVPNMSAVEAHKWHLLSLLRLPFVMVFSEALGETFFFCEDEHTKSALIEAGASEWSIYTRDELRILMEQNRIAPLTVSELNLLHAFKRTFNARIAE